jgi:hypothetical protein
LQNDTSITFLLGFVRDLWDILKEVLHVNWIIMGINNTPSIVWTKIIKPMVFAEYPNEGIVFPSRLWYGYVIPLHISINMVWNPRICYIPWEVYCTCIEKL